MSVRRLADTQPESFAFTPENQAWAEKEIAKYPPGRQASAILALMWRAQKQNAYWLPRPAIELVARMLDMPYIRALEVATFYSMFNLEPVGRHHVQLCGTTPCMLCGAEDIKRVCHEKIGDERHVTADGALSWIEVECLGACCNAPMVQINDDYYEDLTPENFAALLDNLVAGRPVTIGSQTGRVGSEPPGGKLTSLDHALWRGRQGRAQPRPSRRRRRRTHAAEEEAHIKSVLATLPKDATAEQKADAVGKRPSGLAQPRDDTPDDLKRIKGVGPVNERNLNALGLYHFDQIAGWSRDQIRWVGTYLSFPGRIDREQWVAQAENLARGGKGLKDETKGQADA